MNLKQHVREVPDYPKPGILFKDITPLLADGAALSHAIREMAEPYLYDQNVPDFVMGIESRGFIFGTAMAAFLFKCGFVPARKPNKLPCEALCEEIELEYGKTSLHVHKDAFEGKRSRKVLVVDDLLATGGTAEGACKLVQRLGGEVLGVAVLIDLPKVGGRKRLEAQGIPVHAVLTY